MKRITKIIIVIILICIIEMVVKNLILHQKDENGVVYNANYLEDIPEDKEKVLAKSHEDLVKYFNEEYMKNAGPCVDEIINRYNGEFFKNNNLAIIYIDFGNPSTTVEYKKCDINGSTANIAYKVISLKGATPDVFEPVGKFVIVKIPKQVTSIIPEMIYKYK